MEFVETTISEHIYNQGKAEGLAKGLLEGQLVVFENLHQLGILSDAQMNAMAAPIQQKLKDLMK